MTIADQINRLSGAKAAIKQSITNKGVEVSDSALLDEYPALIDKIEVGSGSGEDGPNPYQELYMQRTNDGTNMKGLFYYCSTPELDLIGLDTSKATDMSYMFYYCSSAVNIDGWDTSSLTNTNYMFYNFTGSIDISKLNFSNVTSANYMFSYANTDKIILTGLSFPKTTSLERMFDSATGTTLDLSSWDISNITNMSYLFGSSKFTRIDLTGWKTTNVTNMGYMFNYLRDEVIEIIIPDWDMTKVTSSSSFFSSGSSYNKGLMLIDLSRSNDTTITKIASYLPTRTVTTYGDVLIPVDSSQAAIDALAAKYWRPVGPKFDLISCEVVPELDEILLNKSTKLLAGNREPWYGDETVIEFISSDESVATIDGDIITSTGIVGTTEITARNKETLEVLSVEPTTLVVSETDNYPNVIRFRTASTPSSSSTISINSSNIKFSAMNYNAAGDFYTYDVGAPITKIAFSYLSELIKLNTSNMTDMGAMFYDCNKLTSLDLSNFDTSNVLYMQQMFQGCSALESLDLSNFDMSKVTNKSAMFAGCNSLHTLRLDNCSNDTISKMITYTSFPTGEHPEGVTRKIYCKESEAAGLTEPTNWVFEYIVEGPKPYTIGEFRGNTEITEVNADTTIVNDTHDDLSYMFEGCTALTTVDTTSWDTTSVRNTEGMFSGCTALTSVNLNNWSGGEIPTDFSECTSLTSLYLRGWDTSEITCIILPEGQIEPGGSGGSSFPGLGGGFPGFGNKMIFTDYGSGLTNYVTLPSGWRAM